MKLFVRRLLMLLSLLIGFNKKELGASFRSMFYYLSDLGFAELSPEGDQAVWGDKISAVLFAFWCSVEYNLGFDYSKDEIIEVLKAKENLVSLSGAFAVISNYVRSLLESAGRDYNGQKKGLDDGEEDE